MSLPKNKSNEELQEEEKLATNNEVATETKEEDPRMVGDAKSPDEVMTAPTEKVLAKTDDEAYVQSKKEAEDITGGQKEVGEDSPSAKAADDQPEGLKVPLEKEDKNEITEEQKEKGADAPSVKAADDQPKEQKKEITGGQKEEGEDSQSMKAKKKDKGGARVRMKSEELTNTKQVERDDDLQSVRTFDTISIGSKVSGFSADTSSLRFDEKKHNLNMDHEILSLNLEDVKKNDSGSESSSLSIYDSYLNQNRVSFNPDFLLRMDMSLPNLSDLGASSSEDEELDNISIDDSVTTIKTDQGKFVNPLTGEDISSTESTETESHKASQVETEVVDAVHDDSTTEIDIEIQSIGSDKEIKVITMEEDYETALVEYHQSMLKAPIPQEDETDLTLETRNQLMVYESTLNFLRGLIDRTVQQAETIDANAVLEASLDKQLVLDALYNQVLEYENERRNQQYLTAKIVEHYRRIRNFRPIVPDPGPSKQKLMTSFRKSLEEFDFLLEQKQCVLRMHNDAMNANTQILIDTYDLLTTTQKRFEQLINNTFIRSKSSAKWKSKIETFLKKVNLKLKEISAERVILIRKQHTMAEAMEKMEKIENISPSFTMSAYERMIANVMKLGGLLHDYHVSVGKVRNETYTYWHLITHMREHRNLLQIKIYNQTAKYEDMCEKHKHMRDNICKLKVKHVALQHELSEISFNVGLLDKPLLMHDYDNTKDAIAELTVVVDDLRKQYEGVQKASELRIELMKRRSLKKSESKSTRMSEVASERKFTHINEKSVSFRKSTQIIENVSARKLIRSTENVSMHFKRFKFD